MILEVTPAQFELLLEAVQVRTHQLARMASEPNLRTDAVRLRLGTDSREFDRLWSELEAQREA